MLSQKLIQFLYFDKINSNIVPHYLWNIKVLKRNPFIKPYITIDELDQQHPDSFHQAYELSNAVMVRSYASQNLLKSNVI